MWRGGEKADIGGMSSVDVGMRNSAKYGEIVAKFLQILQVRRQCIVSPAVFWEKRLAQHAQVVANGEHPAGGRCGGGRSRCRGACRYGKHGFQQGKRNGHASGSQKPSSRYSA